MLPGLQGIHWLWGHDRLRLDIGLLSSEHTFEMKGEHPARGGMRGCLSKVA
jgi:hypothetical protein